VIEQARIGESKKEPLSQLLAAAGSITKVAGVSRSENRIGASSQET
jgi:hypothetical protein